MIRRFVLQRREDLTGVSGTGTVAEGVQFSDGKVAIRWKGQVRSTVLYDTVNDAVAIHGHEGRTIVDWLDTPHAPRDTAPARMDPDWG